MKYKEIKALNKDDLDKLAQEIEECKRMNIDVLVPSINESFVDFGVVKDTGNVRFGLSAIKNVGEAAIENTLQRYENQAIDPSVLNKFYSFKFNKM